jgi:hypothetical protein
MGIQWQGARGLRENGKRKEEEAVATTALTAKPDHKQRREDRSDHKKLWYPQGGGPSLPKSALQ